MAATDTEEIKIETPVELTDRELAIAHGENPNEVKAAEPVAETPASEPTKPIGEQTGTEAGPAGGGTEAASSTQSWLDADQKALAGSYGFNDDDLKDFSSAEEFRRATRLIDRQLTAGVEAARQAAAAKPAAETAAPAAQAVANAQASAKLAKLDIEALKAKGYDEETLSLLANHNAVVDELERSRQEREAERKQIETIGSQFQQWQQIQQQQLRAAQVDAFHDAVDSIGDTRFGKTIDDNGRPVAITPQEDALRRKLYETAEMLAAGIVTRAKAANAQPQLPPLPILLRRAQQLAFGEDIRAEERRKVHQEITEQSKKRRPVATSRGPGGQYVRPTNAGPPTMNESVKEISNHPEVLAAWDRITQNAGAAV